MPIGDVFEGRCPCGATHVRSRLVAEWEEEIRKDDPPPESDEGPRCDMCGQVIQMTLVSTAQEGNA